MNFIVNFLRLEQFIFVFSKRFTSIADLKEEELDILCITETWLRKCDDSNISARQISPDGYKILHIPRQSNKKNGGGSEFVCRSS